MWTGPPEYVTYEFVSTSPAVSCISGSSNMNMTTAWKELHFILSVRSDFHMTDSLSIAVHAFASRMLMSFSVDETLHPRLVNLLNY